MQFSDTTNKNGIVQFTESLCKLGDGGITNDTVLFKTITAYINQAYAKVAMALLRVDKNFRWDDFNYTDFAIATITLVDQQRDYTLPAAVVGGNASTLYRVNSVRIKDVSGLFYDLTPLPPNADESQEGAAYSGVPLQYRMIGNSVRLTPKPLTGAITLTNGMEIQFQRSFDEFTSADTTQQPGFMNSYHDLLALDAAAAYLLPFNADLAIQYIGLFNTRLELLQQDYTNKDDNTKNQIVPKYRSSR